MLRRYVPGLLILALVVGGFGCTKHGKKASYLAQANQDFQAQQYEKAEVGYLNVLQVSPLDSVAIRQLGIIYYEQGRLPQAYAYLKKAAELDRDNPDVKLKLGLTYISARKFKEANAEALQVLEKQPGQEDALLLLASSARTFKDVQETQQLIERLRQKDSDKPGYHLALGTLYFQQKDDVKAEGEFNRALAMNPKSSNAHMALGNVYWARNELKQAEQSYLAAAKLSPLRSSKHLKYADFKLQTGAIDEAKKALEELTKQAPDYVPAWTYLMQVAFAERKYEECSTFCKSLLARDPQNYDALLMTGRLNLVQGEGEKALAEFERLNSIYEKVPQVQYQLALAHLLNQDMNKAYRSLNQAIALDSNYREAILLLSELNIRKADFGPAITALTKLVKEQPQITQAHLLLASAYLARKNPDDAIAVYSRMMELFPKDPEIPTLIGMVLSQQDKKAAARKAFEKSLELSPDYLPALGQLVDLDLVDSQYPKALERVNALMEKYPKAAEPQLLLAKINLAQHNQNQAETNLLKAIELNPEQRAPYLLLAQIYVASKKHQQALERLTGLVAKTNDVTALMQIGMIHDALKNYSAARDAYQKTLAVNPKFGPALNNLAYLYSEKLGLLDKAYEMAERGRQLNPYDPYTADTLGWILFKRKEYSRALGLLQESALKLPAEMEVQFHLGMTHYMLGEEESARLALRQAAESNKEFSGKDECRRRLALLTLDPMTADASMLTALEKGLHDDPYDPVALNRLAAIYERDGNYDKAAKTCETALKQNPKNARLMLRLAQLYSSRLNDQPKAMELVKTAHDLDPEDPEISHALSRLVYQTGDHQRALSLIQEAALKLPGQPDLLYDLAWSYYAVGRVTDAEANMRAALTAGAFAKSADAQRFLTMVSPAKNPTQVQESAARAQSILNADPGYVPALMAMAILKEQQGNHQAAKQLYDQILERYPLFAPATRQLAFLYAEHLGDDQKAYALAIKARETFPEDSALAKMLGILVYQRGDYSRSAQLLKESSLKQNPDAELMYYLGMAQYRLKDRAASRASLQRALDLNLSGTPAGEAKKILVEMK